MRQTPQAQSLVARNQLRLVLKAMQHALRAMPLYGEGSPATSRALESLREAFRTVWRTHDLVTLCFQNDGLWLHTGDASASISAASGRRETPLQAFRDAGFDSLTFTRGFELEELPRFLRLATGDLPQDPLEDLATTLWFESFDKVAFVLRDGLHADAQKDATVPILVRSPELVGAPDDPPPLPEALLTRPLTAQELQLDSGESSHLQELIAEEVRRPVCADVLSALLDSMQDGNESLRQEILSRLDSLLPLLLSQGYLQETAGMLQELRSLAEAKVELGRGFCRAVRRTMSQFERSAAVVAFLEDLESGEIVPDLETLSVLAGGLGAVNAKALVRIAERAKGKPIAAVLTAVCENVVARDADLLLELLRSDDELVLRGALRLMTAARTDEAVREVIRLLRHREARLRLAAAKALVCVGRQEAWQALMASLQDEHEDVRQTCAWALATWEYRPAFAAIRNILDGARLQGMALSEKLTYFDAYARLGGKHAVPYLSELLHARHLFRPRFETDLRACAARGLGQIPGSQARQALEKAVEDRDPKVRRIVLRQLRAEQS
jgi:hypothetical protein